LPHVLPSFALYSASDREVLGFALANISAAVAGKTRSLASLSVTLALHTP